MCLSIYMIAGTRSSASRYRILSLERTDVLAQRTMPHLGTRAFSASSCCSIDQHRRLISIKAYNLTHTKHSYSHLVIKFLPWTGFESRTSQSNDCERYHSTMATPPISTQEPV